ncbi:hypothetical protein SAMN02745121_01780 [Nannocystis exedens]|uniref:Secreted protein n=1 Tax=Nannocystis exedens TaxID=54 RepID=A0A1I1VM66_9BACT|nr:hypothetical protein [Nannocystis exedens]PCC72665.1 hypothetical protein NAEX_05748 [Nannocystis exedens]SFD84107.1 hypothetical protein SAMN02745121_01780 [Nannocystis exedens]
MIAHSIPATRPVPKLAAALLAVTLPITTLPLPALAAEDVTPARAAGVRKTVQDRAKPMLSSDPGGAASLLSTEAKKTNDPLLFIDAGEAYLAEGVAERDKAALEQAIEHASIGIDIAAFQQDPRCDPAWQHLDAGEYDRELTRGKKVIEDSEKAIADLDKPVEAPPPVEEPKKEKGTPRDGRGLIAGGSLMTVVGVGGLAMIGAGLALSSKAQKDVDALDPSAIDFDAQFADIDKRGKTANVVAYAGIGVAAVGLGVGIALLALGVKKRKAYRAEHGASESARVHVAPALGYGYGGLTLGGRF